MARTVNNTPAIGNQLVASTEESGGGHICQPFLRRSNTRVADEISQQYFMAVPLLD